MELTEYATKCIEPITEEIYDQAQFISLSVHQYMKHKHASVNGDVVKADAYDVFMHFFETLHDDAYTSLEERPDKHDINEWTEDAYCALVADHVRE